MSCKRLLSLLVLTFTLFGASFFSSCKSDGNDYEAAQKDMASQPQPVEKAQTAEAKAATENERINKEATSETTKEVKTEGKKEESGKLDVSKVIFGHIADSHEWHFLTTTNKEGVPTHWSIPLPVILYHPQKGLVFFSSSKIAEGESYQGFHLQKDLMKEHIVSEDGASIKDISITKNVMSMLISVALLLWLMMGAGKKYKTNGDMKAPSGMQNFIEVIVIFIRDEVAKPCLGNKYKTYLPLLLTIFFFIWINNLLGLLPGGANFTGNIAVTACLALLAFIVILAKSKKHFWSHLLNPPGVPGWMKPMLVLIEVASLFIKPMALMIRLFANIMAGHIVILALICMIFIFAVINTYVGVGFAPVSLAFTIFMFALELLVGAIQAFIFTNLTAVFIGQSIEEGHEEHEAHAH
jgi:F-type H+-transporting ATPase subunit a